MIAMNFQNTYTTFLLTLFCIQLTGQIENLTHSKWKITDRESIVLHFDSTSQLPHKDNIEMAGKNVAAIIYYAIDDDGNLTVDKDVIFPQLRTFNKSNEPEWKKYRAYFRRTAGNDMVPRISCDEQIIVPSKLDSIEIDGTINFYYTPIKGLSFTRQIYPSMDDRLLVEEWTVTNVGIELKDLTFSPFEFTNSEEGYKGTYTYITKSPTDEKIELKQGQGFSFPVYFGALLNEESKNAFNFQHAKTSRNDFLNTCRQKLVLNTPDSILNMLFYFSKIRAAESIFNSSYGVIHSPGGGNYYVGIWANDQVEYSGPFFPYLGYKTGELAAYNAYKKFLENIPKDDHHIPYAFEVDGNFPMTHLDRGDAAMIAYGTSLYLLNSGNIEQAKELWPLIDWSLEFCHKNRNAFGAVESESDEMEGRIKTGDANLSTSTLYYGGLKMSALIAKSLEMPSKVASIESRLEEMEKVIEDYFGANLEGLDTYRYFDQNKYLRHWICLPLTMGIDIRKEGTLQALFGKLWTDNGILVQYDPSNEDKKHMFWDRATLYALRGALKVGGTEIAFEKLKQYSRNRLLGDHVPYAVEAYPENNMKHLSAESALYCRIYIEGLLGIEPVSFSTFKLSPMLPQEWNYLELREFYLFGKSHDISIFRKGENLKVIVKVENKIIYNQLIQESETVKVNSN